jgi:two-component sensor histidine kinase
MMITTGLGLAGPAPVAPGTDASGALAVRRLTQIRALQQRFRNDLQSVCSLASLYGARADGIASEAGFRAVGRRAMALSALYDELMCNVGVGPVGFASYLGRLCARLALTELPGRALILLANSGGAAQGVPGSMDGDAAVALGTAVAELVAAAAGYGQGDVTVDLTLPDEGGRGRLTLSTAARPDGAVSSQFRGGHDLRLARSLVAQAGGELDRFGSSTGAGWCVRF